MSRRLAVVLLASALALAGCSWFGGKDKEEAPAAAAEAPEVRVEPVEQVTDLEIGRTRYGYLLLATGLAPRAGYGKPELRPRRDGKPSPEGFLDFDFVARAPDPSLEAEKGSLAARTLRAAVELKARDLRGVRGVRVHGASGGLEILFPPAEG